MSMQEEGTTDNDISEVPAPSTNSALYDRKPHSKAIRVLTVLAYALSVSLAAILLSIYYIFMWDGHPTLAARSHPQAQIGVTQEGLIHMKIYEDSSRKRDFFQNGSFRSLMDKKGLLEEASSEILRKTSIGNKNEEPEGEEEQEEDSQSIFDYGFLNGTETVLIVTNNSLIVDDYQIGLPEPDPTMDYDDSTLYSTPAWEENSTWMSEQDDFNSDFLNKRSIFMKKLLGHHKVMPK